MRIIFTRFPLESRYGGAEVQTLSLMKGLIERKHGVAFLGSCPTLLEHCDAQGILSAELEIGPPPVTKWHAVSFLWRKAAMQKKLEGALKEFGHVDALCMLSMTEKLLLTPFALAQGLRVIWIEHDRVGNWLTKNPWLPMLKKLSKQVTTVVVSDLSRKIYLDLGWEPARVVAIPNGIDTTRMENGEWRMENKKPHHHSPFSILHSPFHIGTLARLTHDKGVDVLIHAIADLPDVTLTIIGEGPEEGYLRRLITNITGSGSNAGSDEPEPGPDPATRAIPRIRLIRDVDDLGAFYHNLDAFVLPSREHDPFGLVAAEAMLCGTATIVTDACGIASYLKNGEDALVVKANDPTAMKNALLMLRDVDMRKKIAANGERTAHERFSLKTMIDGYELLIGKENH